MDDGYLITLEGIDGSGTTTISKRLAEHYDNTILTTEPTDLWTGKQVRKCLSTNSDTTPFTDFFFFMGDRVNHIEKRIKPAIEEDKMVISDRYADSTRAYQTIALEEAGVPKGYALPYIENTMSPFMHEPDLTLWLDVDIEKSFDRIDGDEKYEQDISFQERVQINYEQFNLEEEERFVRINANQSIDEVVDDCVEEIARNLF